MPRCTARPPSKIAFSNKKKSVRLYTNPFENHIQEAMDLRRSDPQMWSYTRLAEWLSEKTGKRYMAARVVQVFLNRDPSLNQR